MKHRILAFVFSIAVALTASAQVPSLINYQGRLTDSNGAPVTGNKNFAISIYDAATGGNLLYEETIGAVTLDANGVYSFQFGSAGSSSTQVTETIATTDDTNLTYSKSLSNAQVVNNSITVTDGTNSWNQSVGNPGVGATATANTISGFVIGATITNGGSGYTSAPSVTITGSGTGATATATISGGVVTGITINSAGSGYTGGATITIAPPVIPFRVDYSGGTITATYSSAPTAGQTISATYRYTTSAITAAISASSEQWLQLSVDGVNQVPRQRVLAVPFALKAAVSDQATIAQISNTVSDGAITTAKLSPNALNESLVNQGNLIVSKTARPDLISLGYQLFNAQSNSFNDEFSLLGAPSGNNSDTAIWTGTEMIVWGGGTNTGARYNPVNNTWTATTTTNAPSSRGGHTAVWTGTEMIIWGGGTNTGARYNPTTNTWTATSTTNAPSSRSGHTAVWTGTEMIIWGGGSATGSRYNPTTNTWTAPSTTNAPTVSFHTAIWTGTEMIVWGGYNGASYINTGARYNPTTNTWTATSTTNAPFSSAGHTAVWTGTEMIIWGGGTNTGARYNPTTNTWIATSTTNAPSSRSGHTAVWTGTEMIVWGGDFQPNSRIFDDGARYDPIKNTWIETSSIGAPSPRAGHTAVWTGTEMIIWDGGSSTGARLVPGAMYFYTK
jgi:N-acetylneuraminic acid mutarotase